VYWRMAAHAEMVWEENEARLGKRARERKKPGLVW
jgi:hypothetical protein